MSVQIEELKADIAELSSLCDQATRPNVRSELEMTLRRVQTKLTNENERLAKIEAKANKDAAKAAAESKGDQDGVKNTSSFTAEIKSYAWDQSDKFIKIYITLPSVHEISADNVKSSFDPKSFTLDVMGLNGRNHNLSIGNLYEDVDVLKSYHKVKKDNVLLMLKKIREGTTWSHLKQQKKVVEPKKSVSDDPSSGIMDLLKNMYDNGDSQMKQTINKAWSQSRDKESGRGDGMPDMPMM